MSELQPCPSCGKIHAPDEPCPQENMDAEGKEMTKITADTLSLDAVEDLDYEKKQAYYRSMMDDAFGEGKIMNVQLRGDGEKPSQLFVQFRDHGFKISMAGCKGVNRDIYRVSDMIIGNRLNSGNIDKEVAKICTSIEEYRGYVYNPSDEDISSEWRQKIKRILEEAMDTGDEKYVREALTMETIEYHKDEMRKEFKVHLNPKIADSPDIEQKFINLLASNKDLQDTITAFKITLRKNDDQDESQQASGVADVILYIDPKEDASSTLERCKEVLATLVENFEEDEDKGRPVEETPRHNFPINQLIHIAQSGGDFKNWLEDVYGPTKTDAGTWCTLLETFFDKENNHAFFREDSEEAQRLFQFS